MKQRILRVQGKKEASSRNLFQPKETNRDVIGWHISRCRVGVGGIESLQSARGAEDEEECGKKSVSLIT